MGILRKISSIPVRLALQMVFYYPKVIGAGVARAIGRNTGVIETIDGALRFQNGRYAILVIWRPAPGTLPWYIRNILTALTEAECNVILVANSPLTEEARAELTDSCATIILRDNSGYDMGGYRDAVLHLAHGGSSIERLIFLNDSVYFFQDGLREFVARLATSSDDVCAAFESWERRYHFQSFAMSLSGTVVGGRQFQAFWRSYLPVNSRRWAILNGEISFSRAILPAVRSIDLIYSPTDLRPHLDALPASELIALDAFLPQSHRMNDGTARLRFKYLIDEIVRRISVRSQIHAGGLLYLRFLRCPLMKRDLVYRLQFSIYEIERALHAAGRIEHIRDVLSEMRLKGVGTSQPLLRQLQFRYGMI